jgi:6,7-dimethyl-8-ribityllumazine synthase
MVHNSPKIEIPNLPDKKIAIISAQWHPDICDALVSGAKRACSLAGVKEAKVFYVPGSFELPLAAQHAFEGGFDAVVALGLVLRGETPHFDYVCSGVTAGIMDVQLKFSKPIGYGVLMCENLAQAQARAGLPGASEDKGFDSAVAALKLIELNKTF